MCQVFVFWLVVLGPGDGTVTGHVGRFRAPDLFKWGLSPASPGGSYGARTMIGSAPRLLAHPRVWLSHSLPTGRRLLRCGSIEA